MREAGGPGHEGPQGLAKSMCWLFSTSATRTPYPVEQRRGLKWTEGLLKIGL